MEFGLGVIVGLLLSLLVVTTLTFFKTSIVRKVNVAQRAISNAGPKPKGQIYLPDDDATVARKEIIKKNNEIGRDTPISELQ